MNSKPYLSVIVPLYNEKKRFERGFKQISNYLKGKKFKSEIILVNDGSTDQTLKLASKLRKGLGGIRIISYSKNQGKGYAVKTGMLAAGGEFCLVTDIDLSVPISEFDKFLPHLRKFDVVIGSRRLPGSKLNVRQSFIREKMGQIFTLLTNIILGIRGADFTCGFKCFSEKVAQRLFEKQMIKRWGFDSEILFLAQKLKFSIKEIPVVWNNDPKTRVRILHDAFYSLFELLKIRYFDLAQEYNKNPS